MRTDNDSWDITESVGTTAVGVAAMRAAESDRPDALFRDPYARKLIQATGIPGWVEILDSELRADLTGSFGGVGGFMVARTVYFDEYFAAVSAAGIRQVVILAAGLDARAYRLTWPTNTIIYEIDQPQVLAFKTQALADEKPAATRRTIAADLREDWPTALRSEGFDTTAPTAWLAEGLLLYLRPEAQDRLLEDIVTLSAPGSRVALNSGTGRPTLPPEQEQARERLLAQVGINMNIQELAYMDDVRTDPADWFSDRGWGVATSDSIAVLAARGRPTTGFTAELSRQRRLTTAIRPPDPA